MPRRLSVVVPVHNETACLPALVVQLAAALEGVVDEWELIAIDDRSTDGSFEMLREMADRDPRIRALRLSRNRGHQVALRCGLDHADGDVVVTMDADLQHPPPLLREMVERWREGFDVVSMVKTRTHGRAAGKATLGALFYRVFNAISEIPISPGGSDFRLLDRRCVLALRAMPERRPFLRGMVRWIGFEHVELQYEAAARHAGEPQYTVRRLAALASAGFVSFASAPLRLGLSLGAATLCAAAIVAVAMAVVPSIAARPLTAAWLVPMMVVGGLVLVCTGIVGAYVAALLDEARRRPLYFVSDTIGIEARTPER
ncbi:MAG: glycosyltransferase family 2 protein [Myxococcota bacterium]|nr:glycosyltransferase family 2 protein [Myxococcota bacterium]